MAKYVSVDKLLYFKQKIESLFALKTDVPTKTSQLTNDSGFKTTDNNTTYSLSKSGSTITLTGSDGKTTSVTDSDTIVDISGKVDKVDGKGLSANDLTNTLKSNYDAAYTHSQSTHAPTNAQANVIENIKVNGTAQTVTNKAVNITVPTKVSALTNDSGYQTSSQVESAITGKGYQTSSQVQTLINNAISGITGIEFSVVTSLPATGSKGVIYLVAHSHGSGDSYDEYIWVNNAFEKIGNTDIDLSGYWLKSDLVECANSDIDNMFA